MNFLTLKKACTFILTLSVFFSLLSISCTKKTKSNDNEVIFDSIQVNKTQSVNYKGRKLKCNLHVVFTYPIQCKKTFLLDSLQKIFIGKFFPSQYVNLSPKDAVNNFSTQYIKDFQSIKLDSFFDNDDMLEDENDFIYEMDLEDEILYNKDDFISFVVKNTNYEGGAHGFNSIYGYVIDLNTGKILSDEDITGDDYKKNVSSLLVQKIAAAKGLNDVSQLESIGYNAIEDIAPNGNFTISDKGITYYFNESEIAASFIGTTEVFIPYNEVKNYIIDGSPISELAGL